MTCWRCLGPVDLGPFAAFVAGLSWPTPRKPIPPEAAGVVEQVLTWFPGAWADLEPGSLALVRPGQTFPMHSDGQPPGWITLVHVPVLTNPGAWHLFEDEGKRVHFAVAHAYAFDTRRRHSYGNDGASDRVHLLFDVIRAG